MELVKVVIFGMNGVAVARNGLILWENDATGSRKVFKYLPDLWEAIKNQKLLQKSKNTKNAVNYRIFVLLNPSLLSAYAGPYGIPKSE